MPLRRFNKRFVANKSLHQQQGFSLIEVLVSLVIASTGLISIAYQQTKNVNTSMEAYNETQSTLYIEELVELLRANKVAAANGDYNTTLSLVTDLPSGGTSMPELDRYNWFNNMNNTLPGAKASINCTTDRHCLLELKYGSEEAGRKLSLAVIL